MVKITNLKSLTWGAKWPTLGNIATSSFTPEESPDPGFWVPNGYVVVKVALRGSSVQMAFYHLGQNVKLKIIMKSLNGRHNKNGPTVMLERMESLI